MLKAAGTTKPCVLLAGRDALLEALTEHLSARGLAVRHAAVEMTAELVWMTGPRLVVVMGAAADQGEQLRGALQAEPSSARTPILMVRRGRPPRGIDTLASIAPILGAERIGNVVCELAQEMAEGLREGEVLQRRVSATLHSVERKAAFSHLYQSGVRKSQQNPVARPALASQPPAEDETPKVAWTTPPEVTARPISDRVPAQPRAPRDDAATLDMDPTFGDLVSEEDEDEDRQTREMQLPDGFLDLEDQDSRETLPQSPFAAHPQPDTFDPFAEPEQKLVIPDGPRRSDHTMLGLGAVSGRPTVPAPAPTPEVAKPEADAWEAEDAFADLALELGTDTGGKADPSTKPPLEHSGMRVLRQSPTTVDRLAEPEKKAR